MNRFDQLTGWAGKRGSMLLAVAGLAMGAASAPALAQKLTTSLFASGFSSPLYVTQAPGDNNRFFVLEQNTRRIRIYNNGSITGTFLDVSAKASSGGERGLLGLAFHPDYQNNGLFYINYTNTAGDTVIERYQVSANPDVADANSGFQILFVDQPFSNHNGGMIAFGPDGYLYIGMGDGGSSGDPGNRAQNGQELLGKMLRLDVDGGSPYAIPVDNPFVNDPNVRDEIWATGVRNPWRWNFDRLTGDMWMADVGQNVWEEVNFEPAGSPGGVNWGWRLKEGTHCYNPQNDCDPNNITTDPIYEYQHVSGRCSVTGGYVYRGSVMPLLSGTYFFADYCSSDIWSLRYDGTQVTDFLSRKTELDPPGSLAISSIVSFGEDNVGEMYIVDQSGGEIFKIEPVMKLFVQNLVAGQQTTLRTTGATPGRTVYVAYSLRGLGSTPVNQLGVTLALDNPILAGQSVADSTGVATLRRPVPGNASGAQVWVQSAELNNTSSVFSGVVQ